MFFILRRLDSLHPNAHEAFKASRDLEDVITRIEEQKKSGGDALEVRASLMTPVAPMLAEVGLFYLSQLQLVCLV